ncbi:MAG: YihY family inner membrane protein [Anaerolineales bacterium]|nr:YihY family inner membrane protein [Anaerolineales bacterium]
MDNSSSSQSKSLINTTKEIAQEIITESERNELPMRAASLAYYLVFSIFPLVLFLVYLGTGLIDMETALEAVEDFLSELNPAEADAIIGIINQTIDARGRIGLISAIGLIWSASALFYWLIGSLNVIWKANPPPIWRRRLVALVLVLTIGVLFLVSIIISTLSAIPSFIDDGPISSGAALLLDLVVLIIMFWLLYHWVPSKDISTRAALCGAVLGAVLWVLLKVGFAWYLQSGFNMLGAIYGSLASIIGFILWAYFTGLIVLYGAQFGSALQTVVWPKDSDSEPSE